MVKNLPAYTGDAGDTDLIAGSRRYPGGRNGTHSSILAWKIPWTEWPGGLQSLGSHEYTSYFVPGCVYLVCRAGRGQKQVFKEEFQWIRDASIWMSADVPRYGCMRGFSVKSMLTLTQPASFRTVSYCVRRNSVLNESYASIFSSIHSWVCYNSAFGVLSGISNKWTRRPEVSVCEYRHAHGEICILNFICIQKVSPESQETVILSGIKLSIITYSCIGCTLHKVRVYRAYHRYHGFNNFFKTIFLKGLFLGIQPFITCF